jgi:hypothetical protein
MTVFEDLIVELKEENLLENTVLSVNAGADQGFFGNQSAEGDFRELHDSDTHQDKSNRSKAGSNVGNIRDRRKARDHSVHPDTIAEQISTLQTVEHIVASMERSSVGKDFSGFDELRAKKALHVFQQASADPSSSDFAEARADLCAQVSAWEESLAARDDQITVAAMRLYCESCQPALSSQALFSLARFSRARQYSESARGKYEFIVTRLFSRQSDGEKRSLICSKDEMLGHLRTRFSDLHDNPSNPRTDHRDLMLSVLSFDDLAAEAENAQSVEELISSDYFQRLCQLKQETRENFFSPDITAGVIGSNIRVLNKLIDLVSAEYRAGHGEILLKKVGSTHDATMSNAVGRTVEITTLVQEQSAEIEPLETRPSSREDRVDKELIERRKERQPQTVVENKKERARLRAGFAKVNKWLLASTVIVVLLSVGLYVWANYYSEANAVSKDVKVVDVSESQFKDLLKEGRISGDTFYGITKPAWDNLSKENQQDTLEKIQESLIDKGCRRVSLINGKGQPVGFASQGRADVYRP